jgi:putative salt-induced outer membrane protein
MFAWEVAQMWGIRVVATAVVVGVCAAGGVAAEDAVEDGAEGSDGLLGWSGTVDLGYLASSGNTETETLNLAADVSRDFGDWTHNLYLQAVNSSDSGNRSAERYLFGYKLDRALTERSYLFGRIEIERDRFGGVLDRQHVAVGYGRKLLTGAIHQLDLEMGLGFDDLEFSDGRTSDEALISLASEYTWQATDTTTFKQRLRFDSGPENDFAESETVLSVAINTHLSLSLSYLVKYNSTVPAGTESTDAYTAVRLSVSF